MATQKAALVGCKEGPWVSTANMRNLKLRVQGSDDLVVEVAQKFAGLPDCNKVLEGPGDHPIGDLDWARVRVSQGDPKSALCFLVSGNG